MGALGAGTLLAGCSGDGGSGDGGSGDGGSGDGGSGGSTDTATSTPTGTTMSGDGGDGGDGELKVAYVYNEDVRQSGWVNTHEVVRQALEEKYDWYNSQIVESVTVSEAAGTFQDLANQGVQVIEAATFGYGEPAAQVVQNNDIYIETPRLAPVEGYSGPRLGYYLGKLEQPSYAIGRAAGMVTESNTLGMVNSFAIPSTLTELNAFAMGAAQTNPDVSVEVRHVNSWYDPPAERDAAQALVDAGADVIGYRTSTPVALSVAAENDLWGFGYADGFLDTDVGWSKYISSRMWDWTPFYEQTALAAREGTVGDESRFNLDELRGNYYGFPEGGVQLDDFGSDVPSDVADEMTSTVEGLTSGDITDADMFEGTEYANMDPYERVSSVSSYAPPINGEVPS